MPTLAELQAAFVKADDAGNTEDAQAFADAIREHRNPHADEGVMSRTWEGVKGGAARIRDEMFPPGNPLTMLSHSGDGSGRERKADLAEYEATKGDLGTAGAIGDVLPELALTAAPIARAGAAVARVPALARSLGRLAPAAGDIAANAAYSGGKAAYTGGDVGREALAGAGGAVAGRALVRSLAGAAKPFMASEARTLVKQGVTPTPGQLFGDGPLGGFVRNAEDKASSFPLVGDVINYARGRSLGDYGKAEMNQALEPLGKTVKDSGKEALERAQAYVSSQYDEALEGMFMKPEVVRDSLGAGVDMASRNPLLDPRQLATLERYQSRLARLAEEGADGQIVKAVDSEMGAHGRKFLRSANPEDHALGEAFYDLQSAWRKGIESSASPDKVARLTAANEAHRNLLPIAKAVDKAAASGGKFTPGQLQRSYGSFHQGQSDLNRAGQAVLPGRVPDSGSAGRLLMGGAALGGAAIGGPAIAGTVAAALYSRPGINFIVNGLGGYLSPKARQRLLALPPKQAVEVLTQMAERYPELGQQLSAQVGRMMSTQQQRQGAPE